MRTDDDLDHVRAMGELFPIAVHALSQPASVLGGYLDLLEAGVVEPADPDALDRLQLAASRISQILSMLRKAQTSADAAADVHASLLEYRSDARAEPIGG